MMFVDNRQKHGEPFGGSLPGAGVSLPAWPDNWKHPESWSPEFARFLRGERDRALTSFQSDLLSGLDKALKGFDDPFQIFSPDQIKALVNRDLCQQVHRTEDFTLAASLGKLAEGSYQRVRRLVYKSHDQVKEQVLEAEIHKALFPGDDFRGPAARPDYAHWLDSNPEVARHILTGLRDDWFTGSRTHVSVDAFSGLVGRVLADLSSKSGSDADIYQKAVVRVEGAVRRLADLSGANERVARSLFLVAKI